MLIRLLFVFLIAFIQTSVYAASTNATVEDRLTRLERVINSKGLVDIMVRVESLQSELQRLLGEIEVQKHTLEEIKKRQRDLYLDIDRRLLQIERGGNASARQHVDETPATSSASVPAAPVVTAPAEEGASSAQQKGNEQEAYQQAFDLLRALRYDKATQAFRQFLNDYPDGRYAHIAQYWLAETSYHTRKYDTAVKDYQTLIDTYPNSPKRADALLKIGYSQYELKLFDKSKTVLEQLIQSYPGTTEAGQADNLLQKIRLKKVQ